MDVMDIAKWFIKRNLDYPRDTMDGNMKLQKLLYFSQLIFLAKFDKKLFNEPINAYKNGSVVEKVRIKYRDDHYKLITESKVFEETFDENINYTLSVVEDVFGKISAKELSDLNHLHEGWRQAYEYSKGSNDFHHKSLSEISFETVKEFDLESVRKVLDAHTSTKTSTKSFEVINGITFYFDPNEIQLTPEIIEELESFYGEDSAYTLHMDEEDGLTVY